jgi:hypothetical protein
VRRLLALLVVGAAVATLLGASSLARRPGVLSSASPVSALLPVVSLSGSAATVWDCPGPLPVSGGSSSVVSIADPSGRSATASVLVAETEVFGNGAQRILRARSETVSVGGHSELDVPLPDLAPAPRSSGGSKSGHHRGKSGHSSRNTGAHKGNGVANVPSAVDASVSITVAGPGVAVSETVRDGRGLVATPCAPGSATSGFTASGVTSGSSSTWVSVFDPTAAPAVVNVAVGTGSGLVQPAAYQGLSVPPRSSVLVDVGRYVPLRSHVAVAATATVGRVVVGSLTAVDAHVSTGLLGPGHSYQEAGQALAVGIGRPLSSWEMALGPTGPADAEAARIFDPGSRPTSVMLESLVPGSTPATLRVAVAPGQTLTVDAPAPSDRAASAGVLLVRSSGGVGIVVAHEAYHTVREHHVVLSASDAVAGAATTWVVPGLQQDRQATGTLVVTATTAGSSRVVVEELAPGDSGSGSANPVAVRLASAEVSPRAPLVLKLAALLPKGSAAPLGLFVEATSPVLVAGIVSPASSATGSAASVGTVETGVRADP